MGDHHSHVGKGKGAVSAAGLSLCHLSSQDGKKQQDKEDTQLHPAPATSQGWGWSSQLDPELTADGAGMPGMHKGSYGEESSPRLSWVQMCQRDPLGMAGSQAPFHCSVQTLLLPAVP